MAFFTVEVVHRVFFTMPMMIVAIIQVLLNVKLFFSLFIISFFFLLNCYSTDLCHTIFSSLSFSVSRCPCHSSFCSILFLIFTLDLTICRCLTCLHFVFFFCSTCSINRSSHFTQIVHELSKHERLIGLKNHSNDSSFSIKIEFFFFFFFSSLFFVLHWQQDEQRRIIKEILLSMSFNYNSACACADEKQTI